MTDTTVTPAPAVTFSTVALLAPTTKTPVQSVFDSLSPTGSLAADVFATHSGHKVGSVKTALKLLSDNGLIAKRNAKTNNRGRPPVLYFRLADAPALPEPVAKTEAAPVAVDNSAVLAAITG